MAGGRPLETLDLEHGWHIKVLEMYRNGCSDVEVKAYIYELRGSFSNDLWDRWLRDEPEFSETVKMGKMLSEAWWHSKGRKSLENKDFNYTGWYMNMKNRFGWSDKHDIDHTTKGSAISVPQINIINPLNDK